ncbi:MAG: type II toxin-antitoxin system PemK/MazF family toxin [Halalkalicoccus sp.]|nr:type II toxin-antitoxin system PemK/MazF family toxin [Halalkalicoccus sp.]
MSQLHRGDIVRVDLGGPDDDDTRGSEMYKERPAVVIQNDLGNQHSATTIIAPITGGQSGYPFHANLSVSTPGLSKQSYVALDQIRTVDIEERITETLGNVPDHDMGQLDRAIKISLGLDGGGSEPQEIPSTW